MIATLVYLGIAVGCEESGLGFWRSLFWPVMIGRLLAHIAQREAENG